MGSDTVMKSVKRKSFSDLIKIHFIEVPEKCVDSRDKIDAVDQSTRICNHSFTKNCVIKTEIAEQQKS